MKYYAAEGRVSQSRIVGGIEISEEQYREALAGMAQGHVVTIDDGFAVGPKPEPEKEPEPDPPAPEELLEQWRLTASVSAFQAEQALSDFHLLDAVEAWIENDAGDTERRAWRRAQEWRYTSPTIEAACQALGITPEQKDALFKHAETIEA